MATISTHVPAARTTGRPVRDTSPVVEVPARGSARAQLPWIVLSVGGGVSSAVLAAAWLVANIHPL